MIKPSQPPPSDDVERFDISPVGIGLALVGALALVIAVFLPRLESSAFTLGGIQQNTLIQSGDGWWFIGLAAGIAGAVYRSWKTGTKSWAVIVAALIAVGLAYYEGSNSDSLTLYRLNLNGQPNFAAGPVKAKPSVGIYLAGVGGVLALLGGWQMRRDSDLRVVPAGDETDDEPPRSDAEPQPDLRPGKRCPDCAETVLADARVCRYCGFRFEPEHVSGPMTPQEREAILRTTAPRGKPEDSSASEDV
jgi:hypothetical protein